MQQIFDTLGIDPTYILFSLFGFVILAFVLMKYAFAPLVGVLNDRQAKIRGDLDEAQSRRDEMVRLQHEYEDRLAKIEDEARDKIQAAVKDAQAARDEILTRARDEATSIVQRGREEVDAERAKALVDARNQIVDIATAMARRTVAQDVNAANHAGLIDDVIANLGAQREFELTMPGDLSVARRYARALFAVAEKKNEVAAVSQNLAEVVGTATASADLMTVLHHPRITREKKKAILHGIFGGQVHQDVENFLFLVVEKNRATLLPEMTREFKRLVDEHNREDDGVAISVQPLSQAQLSALEVSLQTRFGKKVRLTSRVDEKILGGLVVRVGDKLIDGSVATKLQQLNEQLKRVKVA